MALISFFSTLKSQKVDKYLDPVHFLVTCVLHANLLDIRQPSPTSVYNERGASVFIFLSRAKATYAHTGERLYSHVTGRPFFSGDRRVPKPIAGEFGARRADWLSAGVTSAWRLHKTTTL